MTPPFKLPVKWNDQPTMSGVRPVYVYLRDARQQPIGIAFASVLDSGVAGYVVRAINYHDQLAEALGALANAVSDAADGGISDEQLLATTQRAMDLLAKMNGEKRGNPAAQ